MTRPEKRDRPRVSAETFDLICGRAEQDEAAGEATTMQMIVLDARQALAARDARIAELEASLVAARASGYAAGMERAAVIFEAEYSELKTIVAVVRAEAASLDKQGEIASVDMPLAVHMVWCAVCAEPVPTDDPRRGGSSG